jgi:hypothetical protein
LDDSSVPVQLPATLATDTAGGVGDVGGDDGGASLDEPPQLRPAFAAMTPNAKRNAPRVKCRRVWSIVS